MLLAENSIQNILRFLACPQDKSDLVAEQNYLLCSSCQRRFPIKEGIPLFIDESDKSSQVTRKTELFEGSKEYFQRVFDKRVYEWGVAPYFINEFSFKDSWSLDVGSGAGVVPMINAKRGIGAIGVDISFHGAKLAQETANKLGLKNCFFIVGDAVNLPFKNNVFNLVTNYTTIEHVYDPDKCIADMNRVLAPGGRLFMNTINNFSFMREKGILNALKDFSVEFVGFLKWKFLRDQGHHHEDTPVTYENWKKGMDLDVYHALSYDLLEKTKMVFDVQEFTTCSYSAAGTYYALNPDMSIHEKTLSTSTRVMQKFFLIMGKLAVFKWMGRTISILAVKRNP